MVVQQQATPRVYRKKKKGKAYGTYWADLHVSKGNRRSVNLHTQDPEIAKQKAREELARLKLTTPEAAAAAIDPPPPPPAPPPSPPAAATPPPPPPPQSASAAGWAADVNTAATEAGGAASSEAPDDGAPTPDEYVDPAWVNEMIEQAGAIAVEVQIRLQEWAWKRYAKKDVSGAVPIDSPARAPGQKLFAAAIRRAMPTQIPIPDWVAGIIATAAVTIPMQAAGARPVGERAPTQPTSEPVYEPPMREAA